MLLALISFSLGGSSVWAAEEESQARRASPVDSPVDEVKSGWKDINTPRERSYLQREDRFFLVGKNRVYPVRYHEGKYQLNVNNFQTKSVTTEETFYLSALGDKMAAATPEPETPGAGAPAAAEAAPEGKAAEGETADAAPEAETEEEAAGSGSEVETEEGKAAEGETAGSGSEVEAEEGKAAEGETADASGEESDEETPEVANPTYYVLKGKLYNATGQQLDLEFTKDGLAIKIDTAGKTITVGDSNPAATGYQTLLAAIAANEGVSFTVKRSNDVTVGSAALTDRVVLENGSLTFKHGDRVLTLADAGYTSASDTEEDPDCEDVSSASSSTLRKTLQGAGLTLTTLLIIAALRLTTCKRVRSLAFKKSSTMRRIQDRAHDERALGEENKVDRMLIKTVRAFNKTGRGIGSTAKEWWKAFTEWVSGIFGGKKTA